MLGERYCHERGGGVTWLTKPWILIGTAIYSLRLQPRRITITWKSFFNSFHQQCTGRSLESSSEANWTESSSWSNSNDNPELQLRPAEPETRTTLSICSLGCHSTASLGRSLADPKEVTQSLAEMQLLCHYRRNTLSQFLSNERICNQLYIRYRGYDCRLVTVEMCLCLVTANTTHYEAVKK
jgi:hypothetical protein